MVRRFLNTHPRDFVWRAASAMALVVARDERVVVGCPSFNERAESAGLWRRGYSLDDITAHRPASAGHRRTRRSVRLPERRTPVRSVVREHANEEAA
jgi:hypothetical protein